jgi:hypothetical protein
MNYTELVQNLFNANGEIEAKKLLEDCGLYNDSEKWRPYGGVANSGSHVGRDCPNGESALVELLINGRDANSMKNSKILGVIPKDFNEAMKELYGIENGNVRFMEQKDRSRLAKKTLLRSSGEKERPDMWILDQGIGVPCNRFENTFLSVTDSNKKSIPYVTGTYNTGGSNSIKFAGEYCLKMIVSRIAPELCTSLNPWGFTITRRVEPKGNEKLSSYEYLIPQELETNAEFETGYNTLIKLFSYQVRSTAFLVGGVRTYSETEDHQVKNSSILSDINRLVPNFGLPIYVEDRKTNSYGLVLYGLQNDLNYKKEDLYCSYTGFIKCNDYKVTYQLFVIKNGLGYKYPSGDDIIFFTDTGQTRHTEKKHFLETKVFTDIGLGILRNNIKVFVDCTGLPAQIKEKVFMQDRNRFYDNEYTKTIREQLEYELTNHVGLIKVAEQLRDDKSSHVVDHDEKYDLDKCLLKVPAFRELANGKKIEYALDDNGISNKEPITQQVYPEIFELETEYTKENPKLVEIGRKFQIRLKTDAVSDFFDREDDPGEFYTVCTADSILPQNMKFITGNIHDCGIAVIVLDLPKGIKIDDLIEYKYSITTQRWNRFTGNFFVKVIPYKLTISGNGDEIRPPRKTGIPDYKVVPVHKNDFAKHNFDKYSGAYIDKSQGQILVYVNMDNRDHLYAKRLYANDDPVLDRMDKNYRELLVHSAFGALRFYENGQSDIEDEDKFIRQHTSAECSWMPFYNEPWDDKWTRGDEDTLMAMTLRHKPDEEIANKLGRSITAIQVRKSILRKEGTFYDQYLQSPHWKRIRIKAIEQSNHLCSLCKSKDNLNVHHNDYSRLGEELDSDVIVLCKVCHGLFHQQGKLQDCEDRII